MELGEEATATLQLVRSYRRWHQGIQNRYCCWSAILPMIPRDVSGADGGADFDGGAYAGVAGVVVVVMKVGVG